MHIYILIYTIIIRICIHIRSYIYDSYAHDHLEISSVDRYNMANGIYTYICTRARVDNIYILPVANNVTLMSLN